MFLAEVVEDPGHHGGEAVRLGVNPPGTTGEGAPKSSDVRCPRSSPFSHPHMERSPESAKSEFL